MRDYNIPINGSDFCIEEVQITMLTIFALTEKLIQKFMGLEKWEVKDLLASARNKLGAKKSPQLAYIAQNFEFTRTGLFRGKPVFEPYLQKKLLLIAPWIKFENPSSSASSPSPL